jgi:hypothetical protein
MPDFIFLMHDDAEGVDGTAWGPYFQGLGSAFEGGSAIGGGVCVCKDGPPPEISAHLSGYIRVSAANLDEAKLLLAGNPHFEAGGTVEIRELPHTG